MTNDGFSLAVYLTAKYVWNGYLPLLLGSIHNGKSYEPEPVKGSGLNIWDWRPTLLFGLVAWTAA